MAINAFDMLSIMYKSVKYPSDINHKISKYYKYSTKNVSRYNKSSNLTINSYISNSNISVLRVSFENNIDFLVFMFIKHILKCGYFFCVSRHDFHIITDLRNQDEACFAIDVCPFLRRRDTWYGHDAYEVKYGHRGNRCH